MNWVDPYGLTQSGTTYIDQSPMSPPSTASTLAAIPLGHSPLLWAIPWALLLLIITEQKKPENCQVPHFSVSVPGLSPTQAHIHFHRSLRPTLIGCIISHVILVKNRCIQPNSLPGLALYGTQHSVPLLWGLNNPHLMTIFLFKPKGFNCHLQQWKPLVVQLSYCPEIPSWLKITFQNFVCPLPSSVLLLKGSSV